jgi:CelD/BcsL family acetyltransferase involved in cellulose biosynthesis
VIEAALHEGPPQALLGDWARLYAGQPEATPFMSSEWAAAWFEHYGEGTEPLIVCVRDGGEIVGLAPLVVRRKGLVRVMEPVGMDPGDYWDVLAAPGRREEVADAAARALREHRRRWDAWILRCPPPGSPVVDAIARAGLRSLVRPPIPAPAIALPESFDAYLGSLSSSHRQNLRKHLRRLDNGEVELRELHDTAQLPAALERWQDFRRRQWDSAGKDINPEHLSQRFHDFVLGCVTRLLPTGRAMVWEFAREGEVVGTYVNFADEQAYYWYLGGFDPAHTKVGLGKIAIGHGIRTSIEAGRERYDFGRGAEPYKYWYGAVDRPLAAQVVSSGGVRGLAALAGARAAIAYRERRMNSTSR